MYMYYVYLLDQWCENLGKWKIEIQSVEVKYCSDVYNIIFYVIKLYLVSQSNIYWAIAAIITAYNNSMLVTIHLSNFLVLVRKLEN